MFVAAHTLHVLFILFVCSYVASSSIAQQSTTETRSYVELQKKAESGEVEAQNSLGIMYDKGEGVKQDYVEAVKWYQKAADQGYAEAQFNIGIRYANGLGVKRDYAEAIKWYKKAADQGNADARNNLKILYDERERRKQSKVKTISRTQNISITSNLDDEVLSQLAKERFGGDRLWAVQWVVNHPKEYRKYVSRYIERVNR